jgi:hypothetical protein
LETLQKEQLGTGATEDGRAPTEELSRKSLGHCQFTSNFIYVDF